MRVWHTPGGGGGTRAAKAFTTAAAATHARTRTHARARARTQTYFLKFTGPLLWTVWKRVSCEEPCTLKGFGLPSPVWLQVQG